jgi:hypothetical protein
MHKWTIIYGKEEYEEAYTLFNNLYRGASDFGITFEEP